MKGLAAAVGEALAAAEALGCEDWLLRRHRAARWTSADGSAAAPAGRRQPPPRRAARRGDGRGGRRCSRSSASSRGWRPPARRGCARWPASEAAREPPSSDPLGTRARARPRRRRPARPHRARRGRAPHRRRRPGAPLRGGRPGGLRAQVALPSTAERAAVVRGVVPGIARARRARAQPRGRRDEPAGGRDRRRARARASSGCRPSTRTPRASAAPASRRARSCRSGRRCSTSCASAGIESRAGPDGRRRRRSCCRRRASVLAGDRRATSLVLATGHLGRDEIFAVVDAALRGGRRATWSSRTPTSRRRTLASRTSSSSPGAARWIERCFTTPAHGQVHVGALARGHAGGRPRAHDALDRPRPGRQPAGRGRPRR